MNMHSPAPQVKPENRPDTSGERELALASIRAATARQRLITNLLDTIGVALREKRIDIAGAMEWLHEEGLLDLLPFGPQATRPST
jgi:hypothetical protein